MGRGAGNLFPTTAKFERGGASILAAAGWGKFSARFQHLRGMSALPRIATGGANSRRPPQIASVQLSENANADVEKGRPSRSRGQDCPLASMPLRTRRVPSAGINTVHTP